MLACDAQHAAVPIQCGHVGQAGHVVEVGAPLRQAHLQYLVGIAACLQTALGFGHAI